VLEATRRPITCLKVNLGCRKDAVVYPM
jgi:hypothetical protein